jgi:hypothetical protein
VPGHGLQEEPLAERLAWVHPDILLEEVVRYQLARASEEEGMGIGHREEEVEEQRPQIVPF